MNLTFFHTYSNIPIGLLQRIFFSLTLYCRNKTRLGTVTKLGGPVFLSRQGQEIFLFTKNTDRFRDQASVLSDAYRVSFPGDVAAMA